MNIAHSAWASLLLASTGVVLCTSQAQGQSPAYEQIARNQALQASMKADGSYQLDFLVTGWKLEGKSPEKPDDLRLAEEKTP
jgi:hypothetical protein